jgi:hypothetical protein
MRTGGLEWPMAPSTPSEPQQAASFHVSADAEHSRYLVISGVGRSSPPTRVQHYPRVEDALTRACSSATGARLARAQAVAGH